MHHGSAHSGRPISDASSSVWWRATLPETLEQLEPLNPAPCPITLAWSAEDRIFPPAINGRIARQRIPDARFITLPDVGHLPMLDDPSLTARTILETTTATTRT